MKRLSWAFTLIALFVTLGLSIVHAQDTTSVFGSKRVAIGPEFLAGGSVYAGDVPTGLKTDARFSFNAGALGYLNMTPSFAFILGIVYDSRGVNFHKENDATQLENSTFNYLSFQPGIKFKDFTLGLGIGIPMSAKVEREITGLNATNDIATGSLNTLLELRIGATVPIIEGESGDFRFIINGSYPLSKVYQGSTGFPFVTIATSKDGPVPTVQAGFSYLFGVSK
jgi:hypothetical protein